MVQDEQTTTGRCKATLPDGRIQTVVYTCSPTGYQAVVQYQKVAVRTDPEMVDHSLITRDNSSPNGSLAQGTTGAPVSPSPARLPIVIRRRKLDPNGQHRLSEDRKNQSALLVPQVQERLSSTTESDPALVIDLLSSPATAQKKKKKTAMKID